MDALTLLLSRGGLPGLAIGAVALVITSLVRRWLIPRGTHKEIVALHKEAYAALEATVVELKQQIAILLGRKDVP